MNGWRTKIWSLSRADGGESLIESAISIMVFSIFMVGISAMITTSLRITGTYSNQATQRQKDANFIILEGGLTTGSPTGTYVISGDDVDVDVPISISVDRGFVSFAPEVK